MLYVSTGKEGDCTKHGDFFSRFDFCNFNTVDSLHSTTFGGVHSFTIYSPFHLSRNKGEKSARTFLMEWSLGVSLRNILSGEKLTVSNEFKLIGEIFSSAFIICNMEVATFSDLT